MGDVIYYECWEKSSKDRTRPSFYMDEAGNRYMTLRELFIQHHHEINMISYTCDVSRKQIQHIDDAVELVRIDRNLMEPIPHCHKECLDNLEDSDADTGTA